jgi:Ubiquinone biosynthesis protein COQ7
MEVIARLAAEETLGDRVIKVNHAGEHGAVNIYRAQLLACWWRKSDLKSELREFLDHEKRHRAIFASELTRRGRPRCRSYWLCGVGGFVLGLDWVLRTTFHSGNHCRRRNCCPTASRGPDVSIELGRSSSGFGYQIDI